MSRRPFSALDPLPDDTLVIEASAGTGKTHTLTTLATRFIAERDVRASELLVVTFTRAATAELRDRIRGRLVETAAALDSPSHDAHGDEVIAHLLSIPVDHRRRALDNLTRAIAELDTATISTIHGFAGQALALLGLADEADGGYVDDSGPLTLSVCADVLATAGVEVADASLLPGFKDLVARTQIVLGRPGLVLRPRPEEAGDASEQAEIHLELLERAVTAVREQRARLGHRSYGDILTRLREELTGRGGEAAARLIRSRYRLALVDEFQDTDPDQWAIFQELFRPGSDAASGSNLILVGDPKQAIYAFRGADVHTYVDAVDSVTDARTLDTNWRSDGAVLASVETLLDGVTFGDAKIGFHPVSPAPGHGDRRMVDAAGRPLPALDLRYVPLGGFEGRDLYRGAIRAEPARRRVFADLTARVRSALVDAHIPAEGASAADPTATRRVRPGDIAVLVRSSTEAEGARDALVAAGIPAVLARGTSVLESPAAEQWRWLLDAMRRPTDPRRARAFALGWFGGHDASWLDSADDDDLGPLQERLARWAHVLGSDGVDSFIRRVLADSGVIERVMARSDGDRAVTDIEHIAELLRTVRGSGAASIAGLVAAITPGDDEVKANPDSEREGDAESRRVESEAEAVQIMTIWVAKGLEFPIVCCPTLWSARRSGEAWIWRDDDGGRSYDILKGPWPDRASAAERKAKAEAETDGEALRLLYVALTRARHQTILWFAPANGADGSPLARLLFCRDDDGVFDPDPTRRPLPKDPTDEDLLDRIRAVAGPGGTTDPATISISEVTATPTPVRWEPEDETERPTDLREAVLERVPDRRSGRWSFSSISSRAPDTHDDVDHIDEPAPDPATAAHLAATAMLPDPAHLDGLDAPGVSPLAPLPASAAFGLLVHAIYEHVDFTDAEIAAAVDDRLGRELSWRAIDLTPVSIPDASPADGRGRVIDGVIASLRTSLGTDLDDRSLDSFDRRDRLDELDFELHLPGGIDDRAIGRTLLDHLPGDDPQRPWAEQVAAGLFDVELAGHLTGSIDLILRVRRPDAADRYLVIDYKTNRLHDPAGPPGVDDYSPRRLHQEMSRHHYSLQALLYSVALHRYLRWRVPGYDPAANLGGIRYLFVRGMAGPATRRDGEAVHGVCRWDLPPEAVVAVSDLLAGTESAPSAPPGPDANRADQRSLFDEVGP